MEAKSILAGLVTPVMGCTEPAAISLAVSLATQAAAGHWPAWIEADGTAEAIPEHWPDSEAIEMVVLRTTRNLFKNATAVGLPNTKGQSGIPLAAALGAYLPPDERLNLLKRTDERILALARALLGFGRVCVEVDERDEEVFIECRVIALVGGQRHLGEAVIKGGHDGVALLRRDGRKLFERSLATAEPSAQAQETLAESSLQTLFALTRELSADDRRLALEGARLNREAARVGLERRLGLGVGAALNDMLTRGLLGDGPVTQARIWTAAACDARMSGFELEVMASGGSGNQGIIATLPALALAESLAISEDRLAKALSLGHLVTALMTRGTGLLGGMCGCVIKAGVGSAAACAHLLSDDRAVIEGAINNMAGNMVGEICDGAKVGCALKLATAAGAAVEAALLASVGVSVPSSNGIIGKRAFETLDNIGALSVAMRGVDRRIVEIMRAKA